MKLEDLEAVSKLNREVSDCDFHLATLRSGSRCISIATTRGTVVRDGGDRTRYVTQGFIDQTFSNLVSEIEARRAEHVASLRALGVEVEPTP